MFTDKKYAIPIFVYPCSSVVDSCFPCVSVPRWLISASTKLRMFGNEANQRTDIIRKSGTTNPLRLEQLTRASAVMHLLKKEIRHGAMRQAGERRTERQHQRGLNDAGRDRHRRSAAAERL